MKYLKTYESLNRLPIIGDYANVIGTLSIGVINDVNNKWENEDIYVIEFNDIKLDSEFDIWKTPDGNYEYPAFLSEINYSDSIEELELLIQTNKYNI